MKNESARHLAYLIRVINISSCKVRLHSFLKPYRKAACRVTTNDERRCSHIVKSDVDSDVRGLIRSDLFSSGMVDSSSFWFIMAEHE